MSIRMFPADTNPEGKVFGGIILSHVDRTASVIARKFSHSRTVMQSMYVNLQKPIDIGDILNIEGSVVATKDGTTLIIELIVTKEDPVSDTGEIYVGNVIVKSYHVDNGIVMILDNEIDLSDEKDAKKAEKILKFLNTITNAGKEYVRKDFSN